jgi:TrmH family RNA methyltransferase
MQLLERIRTTDSSLFEVDERVFAKIAYRENPDGWLATFPLPGRELPELTLSANPFLVVCESVEKPGNLGAILRTADAAGVDALIACDPLTDWGNPNVVRASKGALFSVPVAASSSAQTIVWLRDCGIRIIVATPQATTPYTQADLRGPVAITVGEEKHGLSQEWLDQADQAVVIPMFGRVNSLNVATATALLIYEVVRQRSRAHSK